MRSLFYDVKETVWEATPSQSMQGRREERTCLGPLWVSVGLGALQDEAQPRQHAHQPPILGTPPHLHRCCFRVQGAGFWQG